MLNTIMQMIQRGQNPQQIMMQLQQLAQQNPQMQQALNQMNIMNNQMRQSGMSPQQYVMQYAKQNNIDVQQVLNTFRSLGIRL